MARQQRLATERLTAAGVDVPARALLCVVSFHPMNIHAGLDAGVCHPEGIGGVLRGYDRQPGLTDSQIDAIKRPPAAPTCGCPPGVTDTDEPDDRTTPRTSPT